MKLFCSSFFPVRRTFSALMTITKSPVSTCGVKTVFSLPRNRFAAFTATLPSTWSAASITHHLRGTSLALAENVFISEKGTKTTGDARACQPIDRRWDTWTYRSHRHGNARWRTRLCALNSVLMSNMTPKSPVTTRHDKDSPDGDLQVIRASELT